MMMITGVNLSLERLDLIGDDLNSLRKILLLELSRQTTNLNLDFSLQTLKKIYIENGQLILLINTIILILQ